jgi:hypothetical protein
MQKGLFNITGSSGDTTTLVPIESTLGNITSIRITNVHASDSLTVDLFLEDSAAAKSYYLKSTVIPAVTTLLLNEDLSFDSSVLNLKITTTGTSPNVSVIVKG